MVKIILYRASLVKTDAVSEDMLVPDLDSDCLMSAGGDMEISFHQVYSKILNTR